LAVKHLATSTCSLPTSIASRCFLGASFLYAFGLSLDHYHSVFKREAFDLVATRHEPKPQLSDLSFLSVRLCLDLRCWFGL